MQQSGKSGRLLLITTACSMPGTLPSGLMGKFDITKTAGQCSVLQGRSILPRSGSNRTSQPNRGGDCPCRLDPRTKPGILITGKNFGCRSITRADTRLRMFKGQCGNQSLAGPGGSYSAGPGEWCRMLFATIRRGNKTTLSPVPRSVLTIAHLDHQPENNELSNLMAMCQRCHNTYDAPNRTRNRRANQDRASGQELLPFAGKKDAQQSGKC